MNKILGFLVLGTMVGCGVDQVGVETSAVLRCSERECGDGNGAGTYTEEGGFAGIGPNAFMITRFVNPATTGGTVTIEGRYVPPGTSHEVVSTGTIEDVIYGGQHWRVTEVDETLTEPTWNLVNGGGSQPVTGVQIEKMLVIVHLNDESDIKNYTLQFSKYGQETTITDLGNTVIVREVNLQWKNTNSPDPFTQYCFRAPDPDTNAIRTDLVVFQRGIQINAVTADLMAKDDTYTTLSCRYGGIATVRFWGYAYRTTNIELYRAALHMKRASYCGDDSFYTTTGTEIVIHDAVGVNAGDGMTTISNVEAVWGIDGALCVNMPARRHRHAIYNGSYFDPSQCTTPPPSCVSWIPSHGSGILLDRAVNPGAI